MKIESPAGLMTEFGKLLAGSDLFTKVIIAILAFGIFLRLAAPGLSGIAQILKAISRNQDRDNQLQETVMNRIDSQQAKRKRKNPLKTRP